MRKKSASKFYLFLVCLTLIAGLFTLGAASLPHFHDDETAANHFGDCHFCKVQQAVFLSLIGLFFFFSAHLKLSFNIQGSFVPYYLGLILSSPPGRAPPSLS